MAQDADRHIDLTAERLRELFVYDPADGLFRRRITMSTNARAGDIAGSLRPDGRKQIRIDGKFYLTSRLAWLYTYGRWPAPDVDHINRDRGDDRINNLRQATRSQNLANRTKKARSGYSRYTGVSRKRNKWEARISHQGKQVRLGIYDTEVDAAISYDWAAAALFGYFASTNFFPLRLIGDAARS